MAVFVFASNAYSRNQRKFRDVENMSLRVKETTTSSEYTPLLVNKTKSNVWRKYLEKRKRSEEERTRVVRHILCFTTRCFARRQTQPKISSLNELKTKLKRFTQVKQGRTYSQTIVKALHEH